MKANAPEKIYLHPSVKDGEYNRYWLIRKFNQNSVEYTRTDAFIEKACGWLKDCLDNGMWIANDVGCAEKDVIIEHFQNYMKGEEV